MIRILTLWLVLGLLGCADTPPPKTPAADLMITGARVYTMNWADPLPSGETRHPSGGAEWAPDAEAVAVRDGKILAVGSESALAQFQDETTRVVDLGGATLLPGLVDTHTHVFQLGLSLSRVNLYDVETEEEAVARVVERARDVPEGQWIVGQGWDEGKWADRYPDKQLLSAAVPNHPVFMRSLHSFAGWVNQAALDRVGITAASEVPVGGEMHLMEDGSPSGLFLNRAVPMVEDAIPPLNAEQRRANVLGALKQMAADGYVTVHDAGLHAEEMDILEALEQEGALPIRVYAMLSVRDEPLARTWLERGPDSDADSFLVTRSVKAFYDGALGSRGARLLADYSDMAGHRGVSGADYGFNEALTEQMMLAGFQVGIHAIGDAGNRETLDFLQRVIDSSENQRAGRHRIEHAQVIHPDDMARPREMSLVLSMQPPHAVEDKAWAEDRLGPDRIRWAYAWRTLREAGASLVLNADNPGSDHSIFYGMHAALTRRDKSRQPAEGWYPQESLSIDEVVRAYTHWAAYAGFREQLTGVIREGYWADFTAMDIDPFVLSSADPGAILDGEIVLTVVDGKVVYAR